MRVIIFAAFMAAGFFASSCAFGDREDVVPAVTGDDQIIYVAGRYNQHACMWMVNGTASKRIMLPELPATTISWAKDVAVTPWGVIVTGCCYDAATYYPVMWINGVIVSLTPSGYTTYSFNGEQLASHDGKVYIALSSNDVANVWANGVLMPLSLPPGATSSKALSIAVNNSGVLVGGTVTTGGWERAAVWYNGTCTVLEATGFITEVDGVALYGGHWYAAGISAPGYAALWIDGVLNRVDPITNQVVYGMFVYDGMPYLAGRSDASTPCLWGGRVGARQVLSSNTGFARKTLVYDGGIRGHTVISTGWIDDSGTVAAMLWIDGSPFQLDKAGSVAQYTESTAVTFGPKFW